jgi:hypothetical protein
VMGFLRYDLTNYLTRPAWNCDPPDLCLLNGWDYRREPQHLAGLLHFKSNCVEVRAHLEEPI